MLVFVEKQEDLLGALSKIPGASPSHSEAAFGYSFNLADGSVLEIGQTDDDIAGPHVLWLKHYEPAIKEDNIMVVHKIFHESMYRCPVRKNDVAVYMVDPPKAAEKIARLLK